MPKLSCKELMSAKKVNNFFEDPKKKSIDKIFNTYLDSQINKKPKLTDSKSKVWRRRPESAAAPLKSKPINYLEMPYEFIELKTQLN